MLVGSLLAGCSSDRNLAETTGRVPISLGYETSDIYKTRAANGLNSTTLTAGQVKVNVKQHNASWDAANALDYNAGTGGVLTADVRQFYYEDDGSTVDIIAYYPSTASTTFTVQADQSDDESYKASDLMWATPIVGQPRTPATVTLHLNHQMSKIVIKPTAGIGVTKVTKIMLKQVNRSATFDQTTGNVELVSPGTTDDVIVANDASGLTADGSTYYAAVIPEQTLSDTFIEIEADGQTATYCLVASKTFSAGCQYSFDITVNASALNATNAISDWDDSETAIVGQAGLTNALTIGAIEDQEYTGSAITGLSLSVSYNGSTIDPSDYDVYYVDNIEPGVATVAVEYNGLYSAREFNIVVPTNLSELKEWVTASKAYGKCLSYFVFNDGTISETDDGSAIGRIAYIGVSDVDTSLGGTQNILVLQKSDEASSMAWYTSYESSGVSKSTTDLSGYSNTSTLNSKYGSSYAGGRCWSKGLAVSTASQTQWFLASRGQWDLMKGADGMGLGDWERFLNLANITESGFSLYWSSSELNDNTAHHFIISDGSWRDDHRKNGTYRVRACFAF